MGSVGVFADHHSSVQPDAAFAQFGRPDSGWLFDARCGTVAVGALVELHLPLAGVGVGEVTILGRIGRITRPHRIDIAHDLPWRGTVRLHLDPDPKGGTRIRVIADLGQDGLPWLLRHRGVAVSDRVRAGHHGLGLLLSLSGPGAVFTVACGQLAALAVEEINAEGGINGAPLQLVVGDDATDPEIGVRESHRLIRSGCRTILASTTSATFAAVAGSLDGTDVLTVHTLMNEGGQGGEMCLQLGERPRAQLHAALGSLSRTTDSCRWFLAGNDYVWPRLVHHEAIRLLDSSGTSIAGLAYAPLGTRDFSPLIDQIIRSDADAILSTFVGADLVAFERQCHDAGLREQCTTLALALDEPTRERIGDAAAAGMWGVAGYFAEVPTRLNADFLARYRAHAGPTAPPVSSISEATYEAIHLYADAARRAGEMDPRSIARELRSTTAEFARGQVTVTGPESVDQDLYVAQAAVGGFEISQVVRVAL